MLKLTDVKCPLTDFPPTEDTLLRLASKRLRQKCRIRSVRLLKSSVDARDQRDICFSLSLLVEVDNETAVLNSRIPNVCTYTLPPPLAIPRADFAVRPLVVGFGPCGLFAALVLALAGAKPIVIERGEAVDDRQQTVERLWNDGILDPESNILFGEGGAGAFSDGKLTTGTKSPYHPWILEKFVEHGAPPEILTDAKPHIGTDVLAVVIKSIREEIIRLGGTIHFGVKLTGFTDTNGSIIAQCDDKSGEAKTFATSGIILATGHSARDTYQMLYDYDVQLQPKAFSVGVRIEHRQADLNHALYHDEADNPILPPAIYKLATTANGRGVYTFCMCPGGEVVLSASEAGGIVTNGMSYHARDGENANSAVLVSVTPDDYLDDYPDIPLPLRGIAFQREIEQKAFEVAGGKYHAPAFLVGDFLEKRLSEQFGRVKPSIRPNYVVAPPDSYLPAFVCEALRLALPQFERKIKGFAAADAVLTGPETRSSSPLRIVRNEHGEAQHHPYIFPAGEGAGYAGGIMSAATDGIKAALAMIDRKA